MLLVTQILTNCIALSFNSRFGKYVSAMQTGSHGTFLKLSD